MVNSVEEWKAKKHCLDVWPDILRYAENSIPMKDIPNDDLERMKWYGIFYRNRDGKGSYMLRIRITAGELTAEQARTVALIAYEFGHGIIDITTRANLQVQGFDISKVPTALKRLETCRLTTRQTGHDNIRNVNGHPFSGFDPDELIDTRPLCHEITDLFIDNRQYSDLPRKFNISLNGCEKHSVHYWTQDLSFLAHRTKENQPVFKALIGGTQGQKPHLAWHLPVLVKPEQITAITQRLLDLFREKGSREKRERGRFRYLIEEIGISGVMEYLKNKLDFPLEICDEPPPPPSVHENFIGWFKQKQVGLYALGIAVPVGRLTWNQLEGLSLVSRRWGDGTLRTTYDQNIIIPGIPERFLDEAELELAGYGLSPQADSIVKNLVTCTGKQFCNLAVIETKKHALKLIEKLRQKTLVLHGIRINMSGCSNSCGQHHTADIGLKGVRIRRIIGTCDGFDVFLGGGINHQVQMALPYKAGVDVEQLPQLIEEVIKEYYLRHRPGQTFSDYWRKKLDGVTHARVGEEDYRPPVWICESCEYRHFGENPPVFCPACSALRHHFARLVESETDVPSSSSKKADGQKSSSPPEMKPVLHEDGFYAVIEESKVSEGQGTPVTVGGKELALFRVNGNIHAIDNYCPHEGAILADGQINNGVVICPLHGWTFDACSGCSIEPPGNNVSHYETRIEDGKVLIHVPQDEP